MEQEIYYNLSIFFQIVTVIAAIIIGSLQIRINDRLRKLQDFVAISLVPENNPSFAGLRLVNVGNLNIYLKKIEFEDVTHYYKEAVLISVGKDPFFFLRIPTVDIGKSLPLNKEIIIKLFFNNELNEKYITKGAFKITQQLFPVLPQQIQNVMEIPQEIAITGAPSKTPAPQLMQLYLGSAWTYKTNKSDWQL